MSKSNFPPRVPEELGSPRMRDPAPVRHGINPQDPRRICSCGDPNCTVGLSDTEGAGSAQGSSRSSSRASGVENMIDDIRQGRPRDSVSNSRLSDYDTALCYCLEKDMINEDRIRRELMNNPRPSEIEFIRRMQEQMLRTMSGNNLYMTVDLGNEPSKPVGPPASYTAAREPIEQYILTTAQSTSWSDIVGNEAAHEALREAIEAPVLERDLYEYYGMKPPKGVLLFGPPGCGKTMFAKAAATAIGSLYKSDASEVVLLKGAQLQKPYVGETEKLIRQIFAYAREYAAYHKHPLVIFVDECETFLPDRTARTRRVAPWEESNVATLLAELDGLESLGAFLILATNRPEALDEALLRDGRCDRKIKVERPSRLACEAILRKTLAEVPTKADRETLVFAAIESFYDPHYVIHEGHILIGETSGGETRIRKDIAKNFLLEHIISGAMITSVAARAKSFAFRRDRTAKTRSGITTQDIVSAVREIYEENRGLEHSFAINEWKESLNLPALLEKEERNIQ